MDTTSQGIEGSLKIPTYSKEEWNLLKYEIEKAFIPKNLAIDSRPFECEDFISALGNAKKCLKKLKSLFSDLTAENLIECSELNDECINRAVILCGEHSVKNVWTDDECVNLSKEVLNIVLKSCKCDSVTVYLMKSDQNDRLNASKLFAILLPKLSKDEWKFHPSFTQCFMWLLQYIQAPYMKQFVSIVLPLSMNILEDYATRSKQIGLDCLYHVLINTSSAELLWYVQIEILQNILKRLLYYRETELIVPTMSCALEVAEKSSPNLKYTAVNLNWSYYDEILSIALPLMEFEQHIERRQKYGESLCLILKKINFCVVRWLPRILRIIDDYSKTTITELEAVTALDLFLRICWPVAKKHWKMINMIAGKIIFSSDNEKSVKKAELCINLLKQIVPEAILVMDVAVIKSRRTKCK